MGNQLPWLVGETEEQVENITSLCNVMNTLHVAKQIPFKVKKYQFGAMTAACAIFQSCYNEFHNNEKNNLIKAMPLGALPNFIGVALASMPTEYHEVLKELHAPRDAITGGEHIGSFIIFLAPAITYFMVYDEEEVPRWYFNHMQVDVFTEEYQQALFLMIQKTVQENPSSIFKPFLLEGDHEEELSPCEDDIELFKIAEATALTCVKEQFSATQAHLMDGFDREICDRMPDGTQLIQSVSYHKKTVIRIVPIQHEDDDDESKTIIPMPEYFKKS